jgi:hypothetical protein
MGHNILGTDYGSYAVVHACMEIYDNKSDTFSRLVFDQIWSRSKTMDEGLLKTLKSVMSGIDIADDEWKDVHNDSC